MSKMCSADSRIAAYGCVIMSTRAGSLVSYMTLAGLFFFRGGTRSALFSCSR